MERIDAMLDRLPPMYRIAGGSVVQALLSLVAEQMAIFDEDLNRVQRSHWLEDAFDRGDLTKIAALVELTPERWESDDLFRLRVKATIAARLKGAVTPGALTDLLTDLLAAAEPELGIRVMRAPRSAPGEPEPNALGVRLVEFPKRRVRSPALLANGGVLRPLDQITLRNGGLFPTPLLGVLRGVAGGRTASPLLVNLTNGTALGYAGVIRLGQELRFVVLPNGELRGFIDETDVTSRLYSTSEFVPGVPFTPVRPDPHPRPIQLERGDNVLWFISLAMFDVPGLDTAMLAMASPEQRQGLFAETGKPDTGTLFDLAMFYDKPAGVLDAFWDELTPATFVFETPKGVVVRTPDATETAEAETARLVAWLDETLEKLRPAATSASIEPRALASTQLLRDRCIVVGPGAGEVSPTGDDRLAGLGAIFDVTHFDDSRMG